MHRVAGARGRVGHAVARVVASGGQGSHVGRRGGLLAVGVGGHAVGGHAVGSAGGSAHEAGAGWAAGGSGVGGGHGGGGGGLVLAADKEEDAEAEEAKGGWGRIVSFLALTGNAGSGKDSPTPPTTPPTIGPTGVEEAPEVWGSGLAVELVSAGDWLPSSPSVGEDVSEEEGSATAAVDDSAASSADVSRALEVVPSVGVKYMV